MLAEIQVHGPDKEQRLHCSQDPSHVIRLPHGLWFNYLHLRLDEAKNCVWSVHFICWRLLKFNSANVEVIEESLKIVVRRGRVGQEAASLEPLPCLICNFLTRQQPQSSISILSTIHCSSFTFFFYLRSFFCWLCALRPLSRSRPTDRHTRTSWTRGGDRSCARNSQV